MHRVLNFLARAVVFGIVLAAISPSVDALTAQCSGFGAIRIAPLHPSPADVISFQVRSFTADVLGVEQGSLVTLSRTQFLPDNSVSIDVVVTQHPEVFPPIYTTVLVPLDDSYG